jgi:hypothetical protein
MRSPFWKAAVCTALSSLSLVAAEKLNLNSFANQDLRKADSNRVASLVGFLDSQRTNSGNPREPFAPHPWFVWKLRKPTAAPQFLVFEGQPMFSIPGSSSAAVHVFDVAGRQVSSCTFPTGWRMDLKTARLAEELSLGQEVIEACTEPTRRTQNIPRHQFYGLTGSRIALVRLEGSKGEVFRNTYIYDSQMIGPLPPKRTPEQWEAALKSDDQIMVLETLVWLGGRHLDATDEFSMRMVHGVTHEDVSDANLFASVWRRPGVQKELNRLVKSPILWVSEEATLAKTKDTHP